MEELWAKKKRKVTVDPNSAFANIETIEQSMDEAGALRTSRALEQAKMKVGDGIHEWGYRRNKEHAVKQYKPHLACVS